MSQENVEIVRAIYEAINRGDVESARDSLHPDAELHQPLEAPDTDSYYGRDEFERGFALWMSEFDAPRFDPEEIAEAGPGVIMRVRVSGRGKASGAETSIEFFHAWTLRDGKPHQCFVRRERAEALEAAGLKEYAVSQEYVEIVRRMYLRVLAGEPGPSPDFFHPDAEYHTLRTDPDAAVHRGIDEIARHFRDWGEAYSDLRSEPLEIKGNGDSVFVWVRLVGRGASSGVPVELEYAGVWTLREGKVIRVVEYLDRAKALKAVGLEE